MSDRIGIRNERGSGFRWDNHDKVLIFQQVNCLKALYLWNPKIFLIVAVVKVQSTLFVVGTINQKIPANNVHQDNNGGVCSASR